MPTTPAPRVGVPVRNYKSSVPFSFWPVAPTGRRYRQVGTLLVNSPFPILKHHAQVTDRTGEAAAYIELADDFWKAAESTAVPRAVLFYYSFMNLFKAALVLRTRPATGLGFITHGLSMSTDAPNDVSISPPRDRRKHSVFYDALASLGYIIPRSATFNLENDILPHLVVGHRQWSEAASRAELFYPARSIALRCLPTGSPPQMWAEIVLDRAILKRHHVAIGNLAPGAWLKGWRQVTSPTPNEILLQPKATVNYVKQPGAGLLKVTGPLRSCLWRVVSPSSQSAEYYVHRRSSTSVNPPLPQIAYLYMLFFALGYVERYRPAIHSSLLSGKFGGLLAECLRTQPTQMLFLVASEVVERELERFT
ncbi:MAG: YaaC family protein [Actinomycetota bacterium]|nr:YaaC family protein [Actinomycetota bacterium]